VFCCLRTTVCFRFELTEQQQCFRNSAAHESTIFIAFQ
jgi:hypothetical protein